jgi:hypothetical protein
MFIKITGLLTLLCFTLGLLSCYSQYLLKPQEWKGHGTVMTIITKDGKLVELKDVNEVEKTAPDKMIKGHEWNPESKAWSDREVSLSEAKYLWVEQVDGEKIVLLILAISAPFLIGALIFPMDWGCLLCGMTWE